jgi:5'-3' exonuclease
VSVDLTNYLTKNETNDLLDTKANKDLSNVEVDIINKDKFLKVNSSGKIEYDNIDNIDLSDYYNKEEVDGLTSINHDIDSITAYVDSESVGSTATSVLKVYQKKSGHLLLEDEKVFISDETSPSSVFEHTLNFGFKLPMNLIKVV